MPYGFSQIYSLRGVLTGSSGGAGVGPGLFGAPGKARKRISPSSVPRLPGQALPPQARNLGTPYKGITSGLYRVLVKGLQTILWIVGHIRGGHT